MGRSLAATKHFALAKTLRQELRLMQPGDPVFTVEELKNRFNVSQATVTRALERLRREGVIHRPAGRNRLFISDLSRRALHRIAIVRPTWPSPDYDAITRSLILAGEAKGWGFEVYAQQSDMEDLDLARAIGDNDGAMLISGSSRLPEHVVNGLRRPRKPVITLNEVPPLPEINGVSVDNEGAGRQAVEYLASRGHRQILCVISEPPGRTIHERAMGYRDGMRALGITQIDDLLINCPIRPTQNSIEMTFQFLSHWLRQSPVKFTAVFCVAWTGALAVMRALRETANLRVPDDVSILAYAGESLLMPYLNPPLTSVETDMTAYAREAIALMERKLTQADSPGEQILIRTFVAERGSVRNV